MENICIVTNKYPNYVDNNVLVFVQQLVWTMADLNKKCTVICPVPINININYRTLPNKVIETTENGNKLEVHFPKYIGFGQRDYGKFNPAKITTKTFTQVVKKTIKNMDIKPDVLYSHFVTPAGIASAKIGRELNIPAFMAHGEATLGTINHYGHKSVKKELNSLSGVIAVSSQNKGMLLSVEAVPNDKIGVFPNGYRPERFYQRNKNEARKKFSLPLDKFIVCFVGSFDNRKGIERLVQATLDLEDVFIICAGSGPLTPNSENCLYNSTVENADLPYFYSAADIFVLPTLNEGCCNAIIEAMACGLPIISSNLSFNDDILDETCSIRVDPNNVEDIRTSILSFKKDRNLLSRLSIGSLEKAENLVLEKRAENILEFMRVKSADF
jgi:teichuronic acid biosynthesis glycosyltransferase TuaC